MLVRMQPLVSDLKRRNGSNSHNGRQLQCTLDFWIQGDGVVSGGAGREIVVGANSCLPKERAVPAHQTGRTAVRPYPIPERRDRKSFTLQRQSTNTDKRHRQL